MKDRTSEPEGKHGRSTDDRFELEEGRTSGMDLLFLLGFIVFWFALQWWILPSLGVPT